MKSGILVAGLALAGALSINSAAQSATFTLSGGSLFDLPTASYPIPELATGVSVARNATLSLSDPGKVTFTYLGADAGYTNQFWADGSLLFSNKAAGQTPVTLSFGAGVLPISFSTLSPGAQVFNGASPASYSSIAFYASSATSVYALFNDSAPNDRDYNDLIVRLDVAPIPLPAAAWMLLSAIGGLAFFGGRRQTA